MIISPESQRFVKGRGVSANLKIDPWSSRSTSLWRDIVFIIDTVHMDHLAVSPANSQHQKLVYQ